MKKRDELLIAALRELCGGDSWHDDKVQAIDDLAAHLEAEGAPVPDNFHDYGPGRCEVCGWGLANNVDEGCVPGNCAFRPSAGTEAYRLIKARREVLEKRASPPVQSAPPGFRVAGRSGPNVDPRTTEWVRFARNLRDGSPACNDEPYRLLSRLWGVRLQQWGAGCYDILEPIDQPAAPPTSGAGEVCPSCSRRDVCVDCKEPGCVAPAGHEGDHCVRHFPQLAEPGMPSSGSVFDDARSRLAALPGWAITSETRREIERLSRSAPPTSGAGDARQAPGGEWTDATAASLDPGIRRTVQLLRSWGYETTDSGDGVAKQQDKDAVPLPHVVCVVPAPRMAALADELKRRLEGVGITDGTIEAAYNPADMTATLILTDVDDSMLPTQPAPQPSGNPGELPDVVLSETFLQRLSEEESDSHGQPEPQRDGADESFWRGVAYQRGDDIGELSGKLAIARKYSALHKALAKRLRYECSKLIDFLDKKRADTTITLDNRWADLKRAAPAQGPLHCVACGLNWVTHEHRCPESKRMGDEFEAKCRAQARPAPVDVIRGSDGEARELRHCWRIERRRAMCVFVGCGHRAVYYCTLPVAWLACEAHAEAMGVWEASKLGVFATEAPPQVGAGETKGE